MIGDALRRQIRVVKVLPAECEQGFDLQRHLARAGIRIPTIVITAYNEPGLRERCQSAGAAAFLLKPLDGSTLIGVINAATAGRSPSKSLPSKGLQ